jgi:molecular chaperone DnaK
VDVKIYQGEDPDALRNVRIGEFTVRGLSKAPSGNPIIVELALDLDGILHVSAVEKGTGLQKSITIDNAISRFEHEEMAQAKERVQRLFEAEVEEAEEAAEVTQAQSQHALVQARALVEKAERMLDTATAEDREDMIDMIERINDALDSGDIDALKEPVDELSDILFYLES